MLPEKKPREENECTKIRNFRCDVESFRHESLFRFLLSQTNEPFYVEKEKERAERLVSLLPSSTPHFNHLDVASHRVEIGTNI